MDINYKEIFRKELNNIDNYTKYIEDNYYIQTENLNKVIGIEELYNLISSANSNDNIDREIINKINQEVNKHIKIYENKLEETINKNGEKVNLDNIRPKIIDDKSLKFIVDKEIWGKNDLNFLLNKMSLEEKISVLEVRMQQ
ncbi:hypothetical protein KQI18_09065 [Clostridioides mangenotii]|uniref:hypothetical protein n=1 Tax=Metaclostridioides mangenotii TaxID=1540 RepID=UPI001C0F3DC4|nr:hypothetical protein [Clostridioides mangenotii]MBU5307937.1 hypothetical protein [Clostridioides mangenotii]